MTLKKWPNNKRRPEAVRIFGVYGEIGREQYLGPN